MASDGTVRVWVGNLADYSAGRLVGAWVDIEPGADLDELAAEIDRAANVRPGAEEWQVLDVENVPARWRSEGDWSMVEELVEYVDVLDEMRDEVECAAFRAWLDEYGDEVDADTFHESYAGTWSSFTEYAESLADELGILDEVERVAGSASYFDLDAWARDLAYDHSTANDEHGMHVFRSY